MPFHPMKTFPALALLLYLALAVRAATAADSVETQIESLQKAVAAALARRAATLPSDQRPREDLASVYANQLRSRWDNNSGLPELEQLLAQLAALAGNDDPAARAASTLRDTLRQEIAVRAAQQRAEVDALLVRAGEACLAAVAPADLDEIIKVLSPYAPTRGADSSPYGYTSAARGGADPESAQRAARAYQFVTLWQDYLARPPQPGNPDNYNNPFNQLLAIADIGLVPRSRILALHFRPPAPASAPPPAIPTPKPPDQKAQPASMADLLATANAIVQAVRAPEDLGDAMDKLNALGHHGQNSADGSLHDLRNAVKALAASHTRITNRELLQNEDFQIEDPEHPFDEGGPAERRIMSATAAVLRNLRGQLAVRAVASKFSKLNLTPSKDESLADYIERGVAEAIQREDWELVRTAFSIYSISLYGRSIPEWLRTDMTAASAMVVARNQETAGEYGSAIASYRGILGLTGHHIPAVVIGRRLADIRTRHPEAFAEADAHLAIEREAANARNAAYATSRILGIGPQPPSLVLQLMRAEFFSLAATPPNTTDPQALTSYLEEVMAEATIKENWQLLRRALEFYRDIDAVFGSGRQGASPGVRSGPGPGASGPRRAGPGGVAGTQSMPAWLASDIESVAALLTARNQHLAGQYRQAVASYQRVLRGTGRHIPAEAVGKYLTEIKKSHPEAFENPLPPPPRP
jgi:hypothetical protein